MSVTTIDIPCGGCGRVLQAAASSREQQLECAACGKQTRVWSFPALLRDDRGAAGDRQLVSEDSTCFYHSDKRAQVICEQCGRFLCSLCDIEYEGKHVCASCVEHVHKARPDEVFRHRYTYYDSLAMSTAIVPLLFFYFTFFTAPIALFLALYYWREPQSALPRSRWRAVVAVLLAGLQILVWLALLGFLIVGAFSV